MRYLADGIHAIDGVVLTQKWSLMEVPDLCIVTVRDTDSDYEKRMRICDLDFDVLGKGVCKASCGVAIILSKQAALFHKYALNAGTDYSRNRECFFETDMFVFGDEDYKGFADENGRELYINTFHRVVEFCGFRGSCVFCQGKTRIEDELMTLYDFLCRFSSVYNVNLFRYRRVVFYSETRWYTTSVSFSQEDAAKRFYVKTLISGGKK